MAKTLGFSNKIAHDLVIKTAAGALEIYKINKNLEKLISDVASPGGTTEAALKVLLKKEKPNLISILKKAILEANKKSLVLGKNEKEYVEICDFFREAEQGNWKLLTIKDISKKLKINEKDLKKVVPNKNYFLSFYNKEIDLDVMKSITDQELKISTNDEIVQEFFMQKLEIMENYKFGIINILNASIKDPKFFLINLESNKKSIEKYINKIRKKDSNIYSIILTKLLLMIWLFAVNKWLYEETDVDAGLAIINKGIKRIKNNTSLFQKFRMVRIYLQPSLPWKSLLIPFFHHDRLLYFL